MHIASSFQQLTLTKTQDIWIKSAVHWSPTGFQVPNATLVFEF